MSLDQLVATQIPSWDDLVARTGLTLPAPFGYTARLVDDFSPDLDQNGLGVLNIVPFSELDGIVQNGDLVVFMERSTSLDIVHLMKQRGWHGEIIFRAQDGKAVQCAPWGGESEIQEHRCNELGTHRSYKDEKRWNLHIFRVAPKPGQEEQISRLLAGIRNWRMIFHHFRFPPNMEFDPADFRSVDELADIACTLIRGDDVRDVTCIQWVHAILSLVLNFPLNRSTLSQLGVLDVYEKKWMHLGFSDDDIQPLGRLPIVPYSPSDLITAVCRLYLRIPDDTIREVLPILLGAKSIQSAMQGCPPLTIPPIAPLMEYRKLAHTGQLQWKYVATAFNDRLLKLQ